ncbi:type II secretion system protein GspL [Pantoea sp. Mb-10]|uniref:type II secretion system protein GspL n=1 Tax=unclassified Pantoea TaxID=2630326 RepID=UPI001E2EF609|nr:MULTISPECIES: type II secretion system protein GspL [unclassified Pantoea]MCE0489655.1 type II secretion system protein GspL [Pantoea sp. Mb-10]MCE0501240.1 type II secretion system protein GspL [Pantoea sp. Pb-8]
MNLKTKNRHWRVIYFPSSGASEVRWYDQQTGLFGDGFDSLPPPHGANTLLLLPGEALSITSVTLKAANAQRIQWQLEPRMLTPPEQLHTVILASSGNTHLVASIDAAQLRTRLEQLREKGYEPTRALSDTLALAVGTAMKVSGRWIIHTAAGERWALPEACIAPYRDTGSDLHALRWQENEDFVALAEAAISTPYNLLRGAFAPPRRAVIAQKIALSASLTLLLSILLFPLWQGWQYTRDIAHLQHLWLSRYQRYFPGEIPDKPRWQFQQTVQTHQRNQATHSLPTVLQDISPVLAALTDNPVRALRWNSAEKRLRLTFSQPVRADLPQQPPPDLTMNITGHDITIGRSQ